jgi:peroxiredoxin
MKISEHAVTVTLFALVAVLFTSNMFLIQQNRALSRLRRPYLAVGAEVPAFGGHGLDKEEHRFTFSPGSAPLLLMVYSPACEYCERNVDNWRRVLAAADPRRLRIVEVDMSSSGQPPLLLSEKATIIAKPDPSSARAYSLWLTPQTVLVDGSGRVRGIWTGVMTNREVQTLIDMIRG